MESLHRSDDPISDQRLYLPHAKGWIAQIKQDWNREYCFLKNPGEDYFHLLQAGEIYLQHDEEMYCLTCALRLGILTRDRLFWQLGPRPPREMPL